MPVRQGQTLHFGPFTLDPHCGELRTNGTRIKLQGQPIQILEILLERQGQLVTRDEIRQKLWSSDTFVDFDHNLNTAVKKLRQALGDEADTPRYIETLPRYGYRFIGEVKFEDEQVKQNDELENAHRANQSSPKQRATSSSLPRFLVISIIAVVAIAVSTALGFHLLRQPRLTARVPIRAKLPLSGSQPRVPTVSPDGHYLAYIGGTSRQIWLKDLQDESDEPLSGTEWSNDFHYDPSLFWSPDGGYIGFLSSGKLKKIALDSRIVTEICDFDGAYATWGASGVILAKTAKGLVAVSAENGQTRLISSSRFDGIDSHPSFLPDGIHFLFLRFPANRYQTRGGSGILYVGSLNGSAPKSLEVRASGRVKYANGNILYDTQHGLFAQPFDLAKLKLLSKPSLLIPSTGTGVGFTAFQNVLISVPRSGPYQGESELRLYLRNGQPVSGPFVEGFPDYPRFSPDGKRVAYDQIMGENRDIWIYDIHRGVKTRITAGDSFYTGPVWSPDGKRIAYGYMNQKSHGVAVREVDTSAKPEIVFEVGNESTWNYWVRSWSGHDDCLFITVTELGGPRKIGVLCLSGDRKLYLLPDDKNTSRQLPIISPDSKWLAYGITSGGIVIEPYPGPGNNVRVSDTGGFPQWRHDGRELYFGSPDGLMAASLTAVGRDIKVGATTKLLAPSISIAGIGMPFDASPDGQIFVLNTPRVPQGPSESFDVITNFDLLVKK
jgi:DNA-binding winged helix-turn-helix (wHTH) protein/Tol biopolymer transport system component